MNIEIRKLSKYELEKLVQLIKLFTEVFGMNSFTMPHKNHLKALLAEEKVVFIVAIDQDLNVVGGLTVYQLCQYYSPKPLAYIYDLAVTERLQRKGIGKMLMEFTKAYYMKHGYQEIFVQADRVDKLAINFYKKTNPSAEEDVQHFYYTL